MIRIQYRYINSCSMMKVMMKLFGVGVGSVLLIAQTIESFSPPSYQTNYISTALHLSANNDEVQQLLAKAKALREEAAAMKGQSIEDMEAEVEQEKKLAQERQVIMEKARKEREEDDAKNKRSNNMILPVPDNAEAQVQQAASAVERAFKDGITRQTIRFALLEEDEEMSGEENQWPGGAQQMFREAGRPLTESLLREVRAYSKIDDEDELQSTQQSSRMPPTDVSTEDIWDFDGSAIVTATAAGGTHGDVQAVVFPNTGKSALP